LSGEVLVREVLTQSFTPATYLVYTNDSPGPLTPGRDQPDGYQPPQFVSRASMTLTALAQAASPNGWINDGDNRTIGNNVVAGLAQYYPSDAPSHLTTGPSRVFSFAADLAQQPSSYVDAAVVNLFYWCNWMHDRLYDLGFTESAGNYQTYNFGRG